MMEKKHERNIKQPYTCHKAGISLWKCAWSLRGGTFSSIYTLCYH